VTSWGSPLLILTITLLDVCHILCICNVDQSAYFWETVKAMYRFRWREYWRSWHPGERRGWRWRNKSTTWVGSSWRLIMRSVKTAMVVRWNVVGNMRQILWIKTGTWFTHECKVQSCRPTEFPRLVASQLYNMAVSYANSSARLKYTSTNLPSNATASVKSINQEKHFSSITSRERTRCASTTCSS